MQLLRAHLFEVTTEGGCLEMKSTAEKEPRIRRVERERERGAEEREMRGHSGGIHAWNPSVMINNVGTGAHLISARSLTPVAHF